MLLNDPTRFMLYPKQFKLNYCTFGIIPTQIDLINSEEENILLFE